MRHFYLLFWLLAAQVACGQTIPDSLDITAARQVVSEVVLRVVSQTDSAGLCTETLSWDGGGGLVRTYYASGRLKEYVPYADLRMGYLHGLVTTWYENGQLASRQPFIKGERDGTLELYYEQGQLKRQTNYVAGAELPGRCFDAAGRALPYAAYEQPPLYPGGQLQLAKEINKTLRWPRDVPALAGYGPRTVGISFWVEKDGSIRQPQVIVSSQFPSLDRAVLLTIQKLTRRFTPGRRDGLVVQSRYYLPIQFDAVSYYGWPKKNLTGAE